MDTDNDRRIELKSIGATTTACRGCRAPVRWAKTIAGKNILVEHDAHMDELGMISTRFVHFANCPAADAFRRKSR